MDAGLGRGPRWTLAAAVLLVLLADRGADAQRGGGGPGLGGRPNVPPTNRNVKVTVVSRQIYGGLYGDIGYPVSVYGNYGYPAYGFGGWGYGGWGGWGYGYGGMGMSPFDQALAKQQAYALNASRYNAETAQAASSYQQANLLQQQAIAAALSNYKEYKALQDKFDPRTGARRPSPGEMAPATATVPSPRLISPEGRVLWPEVAPANADRDAVDEAVGLATRQARADGFATVSAVAEAKHRLHEYGQPALKSVRQQTTRAVGDRFRDFLNALDGALSTLAERPATDDRSKS